MAANFISSAIIRVFVYGTLKSNQPNNFWLTNLENGYSKLIGRGKTVNKFPLVIGTRYNIPFLLNQIGTGHNVCGEVYEIDAKMLSNLDILENYPAQYDREIQDIIMENNDDEVLGCWLYIIRKFPETMLSKKFLTNYENTNELPYCERSKRDVNIEPINDLDYSSLDDTEIIPLK